MELNPEEVNFWVRIVIVVVFALWGFYAAEKTKGKDTEVKKWYKSLTMLVGLVALIILGATLVMWLFSVRWPPTFDYVILASVAMWAPIIASRK